MQYYFWIRSTMDSISEETSTARPGENTMAELDSQLLPTLPLPLPAITDTNEKFQGNKEEET